MGRARSCWAAVAGGCQGELTREHPAGRKDGLFSSEISVLGFHAKLEEKPVPVEEVHQRILCRGHNHSFSLEIDPAAHHAYRSIREWFFNDAPDPDDDAILWTPMSATIDGYAFGRWLCKFVCNWKAMAGEVPNPGYAKWAVGGNQYPRCWFYWRRPSAAGLNYRRRIFFSEHILMYGDGMSTVVFRVLFMGLEFLLTPMPLPQIRQFLVDQDPEAFDADWGDGDPASIRRSTRLGVANTGFLNFTSWDRPARASSPHHIAPYPPTTSRSRLNRGPSGPDMPIWA